MTDYKVLKLNQREKIILFATSVFLGVIVGWLFFDTYFGMLFSPIIFLALKPQVEIYLKEKRIRNLRNEFRDSLYSFSSSFAAGAHMEEAMEIAAHHITDIYGEKSDMGRELLYMIKKMREVGEHDTTLWNDFASRSGIEDIDDFASVFEATRDSGGDIVRATDRAASLIVDKINVENEMRMLFAQKKMEGRMVGLIPPTMVLFLKLGSPAYLQVMYETFLGRCLMLISLMAMGYSVFLTEKITRLRF